MEFKFLPLRHETIKEKEGRIMKIKKKITIASLLILLFIAMMIIFIIIDSNKPVVCIDAGHGGEDVGAILEKRYEKDDTLKLAKRIKERLKKQGIKVIMTRENNNSISLEERCNLANRKKAELFVSIHRNSAEKGNGIEIWCNSQKKEKDTKLANSILEKLQKTEIQTLRCWTGLQSALWKQAMLRKATRNTSRESETAGTPCSLIRKPWTFRQNPMAPD